MQLDGVCHDNEVLNEEDPGFYKMVPAFGEVPRNDTVLPIISTASRLYHKDS